MGVTGLWTALAPVGRRIDVKTLQGKVLAIDVSIWLTQFVKAMRDDQGKMTPNAHLVGTLRRICKLLYNKVKPVFVFDGGVPELKRQTVAKRRHHRTLQGHSVKRTARQLLLNALLRRKSRREGGGTVSSFNAPSGEESAAGKEAAASSVASHTPAVEEEEGEEEGLFTPETPPDGDVDMDQLSSLPAAQQYEALVKVPQRTACPPPEMMAHTRADQAASAGVAGGGLHPGGRGPSVVLPDPARALPQGGPAQAVSCEWRDRGYHR